MGTKHVLTDDFDPEHALLRMAALDEEKQQRFNAWQTASAEGAPQEEIFRLIEAWIEGNTEEQQAERTLLLLQAGARGLQFIFEAGHQEGERWQAGRWTLVPMAPEEAAEAQPNFQHLLRLFLRQLEKDRKRKRARRRPSSQQVRPAKRPGRHHCLWLEHGQMRCRFLADLGDLYCKKHLKQWREGIAEAVKHPEKWQWREETIDGKTYRDLVYRPQAPLTLGNAEARPEDREENDEDTTGDSPARTSERASRDA